MELYSPDVRRPAIAIAALAAAGLILTGCGPSSGSAASSGTAGSSTGNQSSSTSSGGSSSITVSSGALPFPSTAGDTWFYQNTNGSTSENKVKSVTQVPAGKQVKLESTFKINGTTSHSDFAYIIQPNGQISLPFSQFNSSLTSSASFSVKLVSGGAYWPSASQLSSGKTFHSAMTLEYTIDGKKQQVTTHITATGGGTQSVTVPAGTYRATVVNEVETEKFDGVNVSTEIRTWLASGVGPVQSEIVDVNGTTKDIENKEELTSFVQG